MSNFEHIVVTLADSAADNNLKRLKPGENFGEKKPGGEARIYIGNIDKESDYDKFFNVIKDGDIVTLKVSVSDLAYYLMQAKDEFYHPRNQYRLAISDFYEDLVNSTLAIEEDFFISFVKNTDNRRYYLSPTAKGSREYSKYIRPICLPLLTKFYFIKIEDENGQCRYSFKPVFTPEPLKDDTLNDEIEHHDYPIQVIYYGAPGTGKSYAVNEVTKRHSAVRTTFHPDSDYSTFVGAYKPVMESREVRVVPVVLGTGSTEFKQNNGTYKEDQIVYKFIKQAFLKAYLSAWQKYVEGDGATRKPQFLIIEEINRGNCAQIFGDLFQLLDRDQRGFSKYPIESDSDLCKEINFAFNKDVKSDGSDGEYRLATDIDIEMYVDDYVSVYGCSLSEDIQSGRVLLLPPNFHIWATMNTSDQSLFPIDSAFKRRWEWKYIKIANAYKKEENQFVRDEDGNRIPLGWKIVGEDYQLDWWDFVQAINSHISEIGGSADKQLGYFFCKPKSGVEIDEETFASKVLFYLWNDVFKDNENSIFLVEDGQKEPTFDIFYIEDDATGYSKPDSAKIRQFLRNVMGDKGKILDIKHEGN